MRLQGKWKWYTLLSVLGAVALAAGAMVIIEARAAPPAETAAEPASNQELDAKLLDVSFIDGGNNYGGDNEHPMLKNSSTNDGWGDGDAISDPVWQDTNEDGAPEKNEPACYTRSVESAPSRIRVTVGIKVLPSNVAFTLKGKKGGNPYFEGSGTSTGQRQEITMLALQDLPTTINRFSMTFQWSVVATLPGKSPQTIALPNSTHTVYVVYATPITSISESGTTYTNNLTPKRLDFSIVNSGAVGQSDKITISDKIVRKVHGEITGTYYPFLAGEFPRWIFYSRTTPRALDCHHRALLCALGFGQVGILGHVRCMYPTCYPVPDSVPDYPENSATNDYIGGYLDNEKIKYRQPGSDVQVLLFARKNSFEGCVRVDNTWWTAYPYHQSPSAKALLIWYADLPQRWVKVWDLTFVQVEAVPTDKLADMPDNP